MLELKTCMAVTSHASRSRASTGFGPGVAGYGHVVGASRVTPRAIAPTAVRTTISNAVLPVDAAPWDPLV